MTTADQVNFYAQYTEANPTRLGYSAIEQAAASAVRIAVRRARWVMVS